MISSNQLERVLRRARDSDDAARRIAGAIELVEGVLEDLG